MPKSKHRRRPGDRSVAHPGRGAVRALLEYDDGLGRIIAGRLASKASVRALRGGDSLRGAGGIGESWKSA